MDQKEQGRARCHLRSLAKARMLTLGSRRRVRDAYENRYFLTEAAQEAAHAMPLLDGLDARD